MLLLLLLLLPLTLSLLVPLLLLAPPAFSIWGTERANRSVTQEVVAFHNFRENSREGPHDNERRNASDAKPLRRNGDAGFSQSVFEISRKIGKKSHFTLSNLCQDFQLVVLHS